MLGQMRATMPGMLNSRAEFMKALFRAHNTVNRRLDKPVYNTTRECLNVYRTNIQSRPSREYRHAYLQHIRREWMKVRDTSGIIALRKIQELIRVENEYWGPRDHGTVPEIADEGVPPFPKPGGSQPEPRATPVIRPAGGIRFVGGRFRFGR